MAAYPVPVGRHRRELDIKRSRFIATVTRAIDPQAALAFVEEIRAEFPDANHHCYAFRAGPPGDSSRIGMSDAGEPRGTAGRPMLTILLHAPVGDLAVVVTRYFGGTKLGTGGLVRAYSGALQAALETLPVEPFEPTRQLRVAVDYALHSPLLRWLDQHQGQVLESRFDTRVHLDLSLPLHRESDFRALLESLGGGSSGHELTVIK